MILGFDANTAYVIGTREMSFGAEAGYARAGGVTILGKPPSRQGHWPVSAQGQGASDLAGAGGRKAVSRQGQGASDVVGLGVIPPYTHQGQGAADV